MRTRFWAGVVVAALPTAACGSNATEGGSRIEEEVGSIEQKVQAGELSPPVDITCTSVMLMLPVDPTIAAGYTDRALALDAQGMAQLWLGVSRCPHFAGGEVEYGPASPVNVLLRVQGPFELNPVDGTAFTLPTSYFRALAAWNDGKELFKVMHKLGFDVRAAKEISVGTPGDAGYVYEHGDVGFAWQQSVVTPPLAFPVGTRLVNYRDDDLSRHSRNQKGISRAGLSGIRYQVSAGLGLSDCMKR